MDGLWTDIKYGARVLLKNPGFTLVVMLTLGLGIGANTTIFSVVNSLLLRPLPVEGADRLVVLGVTHEGNDDPHPPAYLDFVDYRSQSDAFDALTGYALGFVGLSADDRTERIFVTYVAPNYFDMLGVQPAAGRLIHAPEGQVPGADPVVVLGYSYWRKRFGADPGVVGKPVKMNGQAFTIVGVTPEGFHGAYALVDPDVYVPLGMATLDAGYRNLLTSREEHQFRTLGRLKPGVSLGQAQASLDVIANQLQTEYPDTNKTVRVHVFPEVQARPEPNSANENPIAAAVFLLLAGVVLLVACVNVANLLLVRATVRQKELAIRAALGAGPQRLLAQMLTESALLAGLGGVAGAAFGWWGSRLLQSIRLPHDIPLRFDLSFDWRVFAYAGAAALAAGIVAGLLPAFRAARTNLNDTLREGGRSQMAGAGRHRTRNVLVVAQVTGSVVLLVAAGLFVRSLGNARSMDLGFDPQGVMNFSMDVSQLGYDEVRGRAFFKQLERRVRALPGVEEVALAHSYPMGYYSLSGYVLAEGHGLAQEERRPIAGYNKVSPGYFVTMRIPILQGRRFTPDDSEHSRPVAVVNELMADRLWPGQDPVGRRFSISGPQGPFLEVVGVSEDGKYNWIFQDPEMYFFVPIAQHYDPLRVLHVRTTVPPETLSVAVQREIRALDADLSVYDAMTMAQSLEGGNGFFLIRMGALFAGALGLLGLLLAVVGVYGVVSSAANQRTYEIGIRMALGAQRGDILRMIVGQGLVLVGIGLVLGIAASFGLGKFIANMLFGISAHDPATFAGVVMLLGAVALLACYIPARRATRVDPLIALRYE